ncbi:Uracil-DNA glycosylase [Lishizhenia tianjinensis]|uniref:Uracil-DNA glycosylase n=1 Tax=Lishizhenia tianjinensis TaxID=477690 RepID=A0A1I6Y0J9_9FLAO|nr:uracil-DNA glycosylase family protein [Lishizhenia tianjinensis]SFT44149.1 Uracil-DNA glycosylase [Lishizhenia tianjinensis]
MTTINDVVNCKLCEDRLEPNPVFQIHADAKVLVMGQAPGLKVHQTKLPFNDASGDRLREWMGIDRSVFYSKQVAILPMALCYPGKGKSGDNPPPAICAKTHHTSLLSYMPNIELTLLIGAYAQKYYCIDNYKNLSERVLHFEEFLPKYFVLPHPSPRNNIWLKKNAWFEEQAVPVLQDLVSSLLKK